MAILFLKTNVEYELPHAVCVIVNSCCYMLY